MTVENANAVRNAALIAAIELILQPEYPAHWLANEVMAPLGFPPVEDYETDENLETVDAELTTLLRVIAEPLIAQLPEELAAQYRRG